MRKKMLVSPAASKRMRDKFPDDEIEVPHEDVKVVLHARRMVISVPRNLVYNHDTSEWGVSGT